MIKSITVTNHKGESLNMVLTRPDLCGLLVASVEGLGPPHSSINIDKISSYDGSRFRSARVESRNIVIRLRLMWNPLIEDARHETYRYFPLKEKIKIEVETDYRTLYTYGFVEYNDPNIFSETEECTISVVCPDPYFYQSGIPNTVIFSGVEPMFEFPFENDPPTENKLIMSEQLPYYAKTVEYLGDVSTGVRMKIHALGEVGDISIYKSESREKMTIVTSKIEKITGKKISAHDTIIISTIRGDRYVKLQRDGELINVVSCLDKHSDWIKMDVGLNTISYEATEGSHRINFELEYNDAYGGI